MADNCACCLPDPERCGNVYFRSRWDYCTEYKVGDLVLHNGMLHLALIAHAGKEPKKEKKEYCFPITGFVPPPPGRFVLGGGYATTVSSEIYHCDVDGGSSNGRIFKPLI